MKKLFLLTLLLALSWNARAIELEGVQVEDGAHVGNTNLVLNGAGVRGKFILDLYIAALYLDAKTTSASAVLESPGEKRIKLFLLRNISGSSFSHAFNKAIRENLTKDELKTFEVDLQQFGQFFDKAGSVKKGDYITMDLQHAVGTQVSINGVSLGTIPSEKFYSALLKVWLGEHPVQDSLKRKMLGGE